MRKIVIVYCLTQINPGNPLKSDVFANFVFIFATSTSKLFFGYINW